MFLLRNKNIPKVIKNMNKGDITDPIKTLNGYMILFLKDIAIAGGFMIIIAHGPGKISLDHYLKSKQE